MFTDSEENYKHSVIITEEDKDISIILSGFFKLAKYRVHTATTAEECLNKIKELNSKIDLVLVNGRIAADRGPMLLVNIKKLNLEIKIFAIAENETNKTRILDYGSDEFAVKPISPTTIVEKASMLLMKKPAESKMS